MIVRAFEVLNVLSQSELERHRYESRLKAQRDYDDFMWNLKYGIEEAREEARAKALVEGLAQGREQGREQGLAQGLAQGKTAGRAEGEIGRIHLCQRLLHRPPTPVEQLATLPLVDLIRLAESLEKELLASPASNGNG